MKATVTYSKGLVYFKAGKINEAITQLESFFDSEAQESKNNRRFMLLQCWLREKNLSKAEDLYSSLEADKFNFPANIYLELYKLSSDESALKYAQKYINHPSSDKNSPDCADLLCFLGSKYWFGTNAGKYATANEYLLIASAHGNAEAKKILDKYGVDGILLTPADPKDKTYHFGVDYELSARKKFFLFLQALHGFNLKIKHLNDSFSKEFKSSFKSVQDIFAGANDLYSKYAMLMINWGIKVLVNYGLDTYSKNDILNKCENMSLRSLIPRFEKQITAIEALKIVGSSDAEVKRMEKSVFESPDTHKEFMMALQSTCNEIGLVVLGILHDQDIIKDEPLSGTIIYNGENISELDDKTLNTKLYNHNEAKNYEYLYPQIIEGLRRQPENVSYYKLAYVLACKFLPKDINIGKKILISCAEYGEDFAFDTGDDCAKLKKGLNSIYADTDSIEDELGAASKELLSLAEKISLAK